MATGPVGPILRRAQPRPWGDAEVRRVGRRAKIVCTIGPASSSETVLRDLFRLGMDVARLNFSHGEHPRHLQVIERLRRLAASEKRSIGILQDLQGPKMRTGKLKSHLPVVLKPGAHLVLTPKDILGTAAMVSTSFPELAREVEAGSRILLADGLIELEVKKVRGQDVECVVIHGGVLGEHKGINLPGAVMSLPSLTPKDLRDLEFGLKHGVDMVAMSFVRTAEDVRAAKERIARHKSDVPVIAKLEKPQAVDHLEEILELADGVMVARGDLGVEMPAEKVPLIQKHIIERASAWRKPVITATQMLESMIESPRPTRAEASDVANAIFDGTDAVMLSGETASGKYPREAVAIMAKIIVETEAHLEQVPRHRRRDERSPSIAETICEAIAHAAEDLSMRAIAVFTETGTTARLISKYRPPTPVYAFTGLQPTCNRMNLYWGVKPLMAEHAPSADDMVQSAEKILLEQGGVEPGEVIGVVAGTRTTAGSTNFMRLHMVGSESGAEVSGKTKRARRARKR